jgi:hypothetical protein
MRGSLAKWVAPPLLWKEVKGAVRLRLRLRQKSGKRVEA